MVAMWQIELARMLLEMGQSHLFEHWAEPGVDEEEKKGFFEQVRFFFFFFSGLFMVLEFWIGLYGDFAFLCGICFFFCSVLFG
jgi:hypothetical protein